MFSSVWRWREAVLGFFFALCGLFWAVSQQGVLAVIGTSLTIVGALIIFAGIQRTRFRVRAEGPGHVQIGDRMIIYYGRQDGGTIAVDALESVQLDATARPACWILKEVGGLPLSVPTNAQNAEKLFDVFASLEGIRTKNMLSTLRSNPDAPVPIWDASQRRLH
ncbi:hypothetical protein [Candidatus Rhodobacter oscarellae]|uniref:hypothetical protein n=1 Tax=Candidatus Rhodobacter oscarellae TaxID=1675527 RepID=UPI00128F88DB|nr:hypothetical protein [Candidatus Rhodobacter lobularis]